MSQQQGLFPSAVWKDLPLSRYTTRFVRQKMNKSLAGVNHFGAADPGMLSVLSASCAASARRNFVACDNVLCTTAWDFIIQFVGSAEPPGQLTSTVIITHTMRHRHACYFVIELHSQLI